MDELTLPALLGISHGEAGRRVSSAGQVGERHTMTGEVQEPLRPVLAAAQAESTVSPEKMAMVTGCLSGLEKATQIPVGQIEAAEETLTEHAKRFGPKDLHSCLVAMENTVNPDGSLSDEQSIRHTRSLQLSKKRDGSYTIKGSLTGGCGAAWQAILGPLAKPRPSDPTGPDLRSAGRRLHDAFEDAALRLLRAGGLPASGGTPATASRRG